MIFYVTGKNDSADMVRNTLGANGFTVRATEPPRSAFLSVYFHLVIDEKPDAPPAVDGVDSPLETAVMNQIAEGSPSGQVLVLRKGGVRNDRALRIVVPANDDERSAAVRAVYRAMQQVVNR